MVDFAKKVRKARAEDLMPGETVEAAVFVQPAGAIGRQIGMGVGGVVGAIAGDKVAKKRTDDLDGADGAGLAAQLPTGKPLVLALTPQRFLVFGHSTLSGKPKDLEVQYSLSQVHAVELDKKKMSYGMVVRFSDGSAAGFDVMKTVKPVPFAEAFTRLKD